MTIIKLQIIGRYTLDIVHSLTLKLPPESPSNPPSNRKIANLPLILCMN